MTYFNSLIIYTNLVVTHRNVTFERLESQSLADYRRTSKTYVIERDDENQKQNAEPEEENTDENSKPTMNKTICKNQIK